MRGEERCQTHANLCTFYLIPAEYTEYRATQRIQNNNRKHQSTCVLTNIGDSLEQL